MADANPNGKLTVEFRLQQLEAGQSVLTKNYTTLIADDRAILDRFDGLTKTLSGAFSGITSSLGELGERMALLEKLAATTAETVEKLVALIKIRPRKRLREKG